MNARFLRPARLALASLAICVAGATAQTARGGAYLAVIGPAPLRFQNAAARTFAFPVFKPAAAQTNAVAEKVEPAKTADPAAVTAPVETQPEMADPLPKPIGDPVEPAVQHASAPTSDMLLVTPQMLIEYLRPTPGATNSNASVIVPFSFTPPIEKTPQSSRATYKTQ